jgi:hypothetical protein
VTTTRAREDRTRRTMSRRTRRALAAVVLLAPLGMAPAVRAGHEFPFYPSFYPQEITVAVIPPADATAKLADGSVHAYVGADPFAGATVPANVAHVESLGAYVLVRLNPAAPFFAEPARRCRTARALADGLAWTGSARRHPYPVTPFHPDYLQHADLAEAAAAEPPVPWDGARLRVRAASPAAAALIPAAWRAPGPDWDAAVDALDVASLWTAAAVGPNGGVGPPWLKAGWSHAYQALRDGLADPAARQEADALHDRLVRGGGPLSERLQRERELVSVLRRGCERMVAGYTLRVERLYVEYSGGVENVAHDAEAGLVSAIFPRTIKLKDFPWNGWLTVGVPEAPAAAWNPLAGFTDRAGRLLWLALSDPAFFPAPHGAGWVANRVTVAAVDGGASGVTVPDDAIVPERGSGRPRKVGPGHRAGARVLYRVLGSRFHDGTRLEVADLVYALGLAWRTGDPAVAAATARLTERLVGLRVLRVETDVLAFGEDKLTYEVPIVEVFVDPPGMDPREAPLVAPPWTTVPWHLLSLTEEAVARGFAAFSREAAAGRGVPWLDLARDPALAARLRALVEDWERSGHVPAALAGMVMPAEARARWAALRAFHDATGHFLVANGPYRLASWTPDRTILQVFRDLSYPRGVGVFDSHAVPLRAFITAAEPRGDGLVLRGEVERIDRFGREYRIVREPFVKRALEQDRRSLPVAHYVVIGPDGRVAAAGTAQAADPGDYTVDLRALVRPGRYAVLAALTVDDARTGLAVRVVPWTR